MHKLSILFAVLSIFLLSVLAAPLPSDQALEKRQGSGRGTWFEVAVNESACGTWNNDGEMIVAVSTGTFGTGSNCGKRLWITANGKTQSATVGDECPSCGAGDLDMSPTLFESFGVSLGVGVLGISWGWS